MHIMYRSRKAFTLVELMVAMGLLAVMLMLFTFLLGGTQRLWVEGNQRVENFQSGRAIMNLIARDLAGATLVRNVGKIRLQCVQNPFAANQVVVPTLAKLSDGATFADSLFWQTLAMAPPPAPVGLPEDPKSPVVCGLGYYLTRDDAAATYRLNRLFIPPDNYPSTDTKHLYKIYDGKNDYTPPFSKDPPFQTSAPWITSLPPSAFIPNTPSTAVRVISDGIVAFWIQCYDVNGKAIPWFCQPVPLGSYQGVGTNIKFNSAARFQAPVPGGALPLNYTSGSTEEANLLPASVEITFITVDSRELIRKPVIPQMADIKAPEDIPDAVRAFSKALIDNEVRSGRTFTTRIRMENGME